MLLLIVAGLGLAWLAGLYTELWWIRREHPGVYFALLLSMKKKKEGR